MKSTDSTSFQQAWIRLNNPEEDQRNEQSLIDLLALPSLSCGHVNQDLAISLFFWNEDDLRRKQDFFLGLSSLIGGQTLQRR